MYLSRLILNPLCAQVRAELARPYEMHRTLSHAFPPDTFRKTRDDDDAAGILFRVDQSPRDQRIVVLVQSKIAPDWSFLAEKKDARGQPYLVPASALGDGTLRANPATTEFDLTQKIRAGQTLAFRLRANPTKRLGKSAGDDHHKRVGIYDEEKQIEWLTRKAEANGFRVVRAQISRDERIEDEIHRDKETTFNLSLLAVQFDGLLQVVDVAQVCKTVEAGIGSGKGFGFGLLSLAPA